MATAQEAITIAAAGGLDAVYTHRPGAWQILDYTPCYPPGRRLGENRHIPGVNGRLAVPREFDELKLNLRWKIKGHRDQNGTKYDDPFEGAAINHLYLLEHVVNYAPERAATFTRRTGDEDAFTFIIEDWTAAPAPRSGGETLLAVLELTVPAYRIVVP